MTVSICLIVRDEEEKLSVCLRSIVGLANETIVVDTGSIDGTREFASKLGTRVFCFPWCENFAAARNDAILHATGDFIFWMDADERIDEANRDKLGQLFATLRRRDDSPPPNVAYVMNCWSVGEGQGNSGTVVQHVRLFRNRSDIRWKYRVHEQILPALRATGAEVIFTDIVIQHTGYVDPAFTRQKLERNLRLLHLDHVDHPDDPYILFHLGWGHLELNRVPEAIAFLQASLNGSQPGDSIVKKLFALLAQAHHRLGQRNDALAACRAGRARYPEDPELLYLEGIFQRERRNWPAAERSLRTLIGKEVSHRVHGEYREEGSPSSVSSVSSVAKNSSFGSADVGLTGYLARHQLALLYYQQGRWTEAETEWNFALSDRPTYLDALKGLGEMYLKQSCWQELNEVVRRLVDEKPNHGSNGEARYEGQILKARGMLARKEFDVARTVLEPMIAAQPDLLLPRVILSHVLLQEGKALTEAERVLREIVQVDPTQAESWRNLAVLLRQQGNLDEALEACRTGWRHSLNYPTLPLLLGITLAEKGNLPAAEMCFLRLLELPYEGPMPDEHLEARHQLALIYQKTRHPAEAEAQWRTILAERPDYAPAIEALRQPQSPNGTAHAIPKESQSTETSPATKDNLASIIVLCCNQLEFTRQCLESVVRCTRHPYELILVDNGSIDGTREYLEELRSRAIPSLPLTAYHSPLTPPIEIIHNESNLGYPAGCNQALSRSQGRFLVFLNNDVIVTDGWLDCLVSWATRDGSNIGLVGPVTNAATEPQQISVDYSDLADLPAFAACRRQDKAGRALNVDRLTGFCLLVRREVFEKVGNFDEQFGLGFFDDDDLCVRAREAGFQLILAEDVFVHHFGSRTFRGLGIDCTQQIVSNFERFKKKWGDERAAGYRLVKPND
jgi:GT2 family glycosyltransferase/tetratricopeptide (TPR) repeat protein